MYKRTKMVAAVLSLIMLSSCATVDRFGERATQYNIEAETSRNQVTLLNIIRSAYRKPSQFTDITSVSGNGSASAGLGTTFPLGGLASGYQINPTATFSGGPTFAVGTTNTKEFYSGLLSQVPTQVVANYIQVGRSRNLLFTLLVSRVTIRDHSSVQSTANEYNNLKEYEEFQVLLGGLIDAGLTVHPSFTFKSMGPPLSPSDVRHADILAALVAQGLDLKRTLGTNGRESYEVGKTQIDYIFCFDRSLIRSRNDNLNSELIKRRECGSVEPVKTSDDYGLTLTLRNTDSILAFLGEITRNQLHLVPNGPRFDPIFNFRTDNGPGETDILFRLRREAGDRSLSVNYEGSNYSVAADPSGRDHSSEVIKFVEELVALNSSAKDLPAPSTITVIGR